ncbi:uncharacterized protein BO80DRAFT_23479 [Aspergillus ibericus CBS 121593]|uniref:Uncharacterized protein n=1 Tax=Aspergillus ibericus CBS 121593 TaxID=1448316 RepID=A0A395H780_9EURO|nr:hypothetical protein BO80DRAFT_23479 [Aspergillus ibericus CBS 121593]RAL03025.1 hypothetical protein BO80DRAFT_23479 [Aspergillus ibericus CBS 121593]
MGGKRPLGGKEGGGGGGEGGKDEGRGRRKKKVPRPGWEEAGRVRWWSVEIKRKVSASRPWPKSPAPLVHHRLVLLGFLLITLNSLFTLPNSIRLGFQAPCSWSV